VSSLSDQVELGRTAQHVTGAERLGFSDVLSYWEGRFGLIKLEDRNLPEGTFTPFFKPSTKSDRGFTFGLRHANQPRLA
jgi:hypothetical protein